MKPLKLVSIYTRDAADQDTDSLLAQQAMEQFTIEKVNPGSLSM